MPVLVNNDQSANKVDVRWLKKEARRVLKALELEDDELSILLTDDPGIHELNRQDRKSVV